MIARTLSGIVATGAFHIHFSVSTLADQHTASCPMAILLKWAKPMGKADGHAVCVASCYFCSMRYQ
jgi:hypothetical protein